MAQKDRDAALLDGRVRLGAPDLHGSIGGTEEIEIVDLLLDERVVRDLDELDQLVHGPRWHLYCQSFKSI
jgi:hypothetical protein